nr:hypothetical protein [Pseudomonas sp. TH10]
MTLTRGNRAIAAHAEDGRALHLFKTLGKGNGNAYVGEFACADMVERIQPDVTGQPRTAIVFRLVPVGTPSEVIEAEEDAEDNADLPDTLAAARLAALAACKLGSDGLGQSAPRKIYQRSRKVVHYVLMRADGVCESCKKQAPFLKKWHALPRTASRKPTLRWWVGSPALCGCRMPKLPSRNSFWNARSVDERKA